MENRIKHLWTQTRCQTTCTPQLSYVSSACEPLRCKLPVAYKQLQCHWLYLHFRPGLVRLIFLPFKSIYYQTGRAWQKEDFRLKNINDLPSEALEINKWTIVCPLNSTHKVGRTTRNKTDPVLSSQFNVYTNILYRPFRRQITDLVLNVSFWPELEHKMAFVYSRKDDVAVTSFWSQACNK